MTSIEAEDSAIGKTKSRLAKAALAPAAINAAINALTAWSKFGSHTAIPVTQDSISSDALAVFGHAVWITLTLAIAATSVTFLTFKSGRPRPPYFPRVFLLTLKHVMFAFGVGVSLAIIWHRAFGEVLVAPKTGVAMVAVAAAAASWLVTFMTMKELVGDGAHPPIVLSS